VHYVPPRPAHRNPTSRTNRRHECGRAVTVNLTEEVTVDLTEPDTNDLTLERSPPASRPNGGHEAHSIVDLTGSDRNDLAPERETADDEPPKADGKGIDLVADTASGGHEAGSVEIIDLAELRTLDITPDIAPFFGHTAAATHNVVRGSAPDTVPFLGPTATLNIVRGSAGDCSSKYTTALNSPVAIHSTSIARVAVQFF
jgi:hypothetical protein